MQWLCLSRGEGKNQNHCVSPWNTREPLAEHHQLEAFTCGVKSIDKWCFSGGRKAHTGGLSTVWVCAEANGALAGFFTLTNHVISGVDIPGKDSAGLQTSPATLLGKLAVRQDLRGQGFGSLLLRHALECAVLGSEYVASRLIYLDAGDPGLIKWYADHSFKSMSDVTPHRMYMKMSTARAALAQG